MRRAGLLHSLTVKLTHVSSSAAGSGGGWGWGDMAGCPNRWRATCCSIHTCGNQPQTEVGSVLSPGMTLIFASACELRVSGLHDGMPVVRVCAHRSWHSLRLIHSWRPVDGMNHEVMSPHYQTHLGNIVLDQRRIEFSPFSKAGKARLKWKIIRTFPKSFPLL